MMSSSFSKCGMKHGSGKAAVDWIRKILSKEWRSATGILRMIVQGWGSDLTCGFEAWVGFG